jgi:L-ascorbate metabolism protein UlaG (beta-lactamase superfamily)
LGIIVIRERIKMVSKRIANPDLKTILPSWQGTPLDGNGRFMNHEFPFKQSLGQVFKWMTQTNPQKKFKKEDTWKIPVVKDDSFLSQQNDMIVPLGHASFFIRLAGKNILIDPVIGTIPANKRFSEFPVSPSKLVNIDYVLVSHAHFDHCDKPSLKLIQKQNPNAKFLTGLGMESLFRSWGSTNEIQEAGWYQQYNIDDELEIFYLPTRHWSNRSLSDINKRLWGAYIIRSNERMIYVGADSGYGSHYKEVGELFPGIDVALIGTGAYSPRWFMGPNHQDPEHSVIAFNETKAKVMIPFHYGTFDVSDEPLSEPEQLLRKLQSENRINNTLHIPSLGEPYLI